MRLASLVAAAALAACSGWPQSEPVAGTSNEPVAALAAAPAAGIADRAASWMSVSAKTSSELLYVSDLGTFDVDVYSYPSLARAGKLTGFDEPQGECTDATGNVWITNTRVSQILAYAHGGTSPIATLADPLGYPVGCAVDPATGNLAVTNLYGFSGAGSVLVYKHARGTPASYGNPNLYYYYFAGYDRKGDLYVSGQTSKKAYLLAVLPHAATSMALVSIKGGTIYFPGTVAWIGSTLVLGDQRCNDRASSCFYRLSVSGTTARVTGATPLKEACDVAEAWIGTSRLAAGSYANCGGGRSSAEIWPFPAGGNPKVRVTGLSIPVGATLSVSTGLVQR